MQPVICPTNKPDHGPDNHGAKLVNSMDHSLAEEIDIVDKHKGHIDNYAKEEIQGSIPGPRTIIPHVPDEFESVGSPGGLSDC